MGVWRHFVLALAVMLCLTACGDKRPFTSESYVFGTRVEVQVAESLPEAQLRAVVAQVLAEFDRMHRTYHAWQPSALMALNTELAAGKKSPVSLEMADLLREAQQFSQQTSGLFDPGIGQLIALWGFQADSYAQQLPNQAAIQSWRRAHPSVRDLHIESHADRAWVSSTNSRVAIDMGGTLKGTALDRAADILRAAGVKNALINIGGNVMALGTRYGASWRVAIQAPRYAGPLAILALKDGEAIGTSGDYQRYFEVDGQRYAHLLDPRTGYPAQQAQAVTIVVDGARAGVRSDVLTKPLFISGTDDWPAMAERLGLSQVLYVAADGTVTVTPVLAERLKFEHHEGKLPEIRRLSP